MLFNGFAVCGKNLLKNIDLSLTALGGFVSNSESQIAYLEEQTHAVSMLLR